MSKHLLEVARKLSSVPTAPFRERWMLRAVDDILGSMPGLRMRSDEWGNRVAVVGPDNGESPLLFVAHVDHPGFVFGESVKLDKLGLISGEFAGRVLDDFFPGAPVRLFRSADDKGIRAIILEASARAGLDNTRQITLETEEDPTGAVLGMWDVPIFDIRDGHIVSRVCDDLAGLAAILVAMESLAQNPDELPCPVGAIITVAEEAGLCGAALLASDESPEALVPRDALIVSVEISSERTNTPLGSGAVLRVGDKQSSFDAMFLARMAAAMEPHRDNGLNYTRALMDGGTCEATAFAVYGFRCGALCAPVRHYHNMDLDRGVVSAEEVSVLDLTMLSNMIATIGRGLPPEKGHLQSLRSEMEKRADRCRRRVPCV